MAKVCFIVPVFDGANHILSFFSNVIKNSTNQIFVFVNDGSFDNSLEILLKLSQGNSNLYVINNIKNQGQSMARNTGIDFLKSSKFDVSHVSFLDIDDTVTPDYFNDFSKLDSDKVYVKNFISVSSRGDFIIDNHDDIDCFEKITGGEFLRFLVDWKATVSACNKIIPIDLVPRFVEDIKEEDTIFSFELACSDAIFVKSDCGAYKYHRHFESSTAIVDIRIFDLFGVLEIVENLLAERGYLNFYDKFKSFWLNVVFCDRLSKISLYFRIIVICSVYLSDRYEFGLKNVFFLLAKSTFQSVKRML